MANLYLRNVPEDLIRSLKFGALECGETLRAHCIRKLGGIGKAEQPKGNGKTEQPKGNGKTESRPTLKPTPKLASPKKRR